MITDHGDGTASLSYRAPGHAVLDAAVGMGYFAAVANDELLAAGVVALADGAPLPVVTCTAAMVAAGRARPEIQGDQIPHPVTAAKFVDHLTRRHLERVRNRGRAALRERALPALATDDPLEAV